jgi:hypothetical protein
MSFMVPNLIDISPKKKSGHHLCTIHSLGTHSRLPLINSPLPAKSSRLTPFTVFGAPRLAINEIEDNIKNDIYVDMKMKTGAMSSHANEEEQSSFTLAHVRSCERV